MKKLRIILPLFLISLLFIPKVYARTSFDFVTQNFSVIDTYLNNHSNKTISDFYEMIFNNIDYEPTYSNYICNYVNSNYLDCFSSDNDFIINSYYSSGGFLNLYNSSSTTRDRYTITFNNNGEYVSSTTQHWNLTSLNIAYAQPSSSSKLWSLPVATNIDEINFDNSTLPSNLDKIQNITFNNGVSYPNGDNLIFWAFTLGTNYSYDPIDYYGEEPNPYACTFDTSSLGFRDTSISHIKEFSVRISGDIPPNEYGYEGEIILQRSGTLIDDSSMSFNITTNNLSTNPSNIDINADYTWENSTNQLIIHYTIDSLNQNSSEYANVIIHVTSDSSSSEAFLNGTMNLFICKPSNLDNNITYGYIDNDTGNTISTDYALMNFLSDTNNPNLETFINMKTLLPPGPVDSILTIPLTMLNIINNWLNGEYCEPITINLPWINRDIHLQCMRTFYHDIGATAFFEGVGSIASLIILVQYFVGLYNWIDDNLQVTHKKLKAWGTGEV